MTSSEDHVLVKLLTGSSTGNAAPGMVVHASSSDVLSKLLSGTVDSSAGGANAYILYIPGFRKIEPKPGVDLKDDAEDKDRVDKDCKSISATRLLGINATKRGVKTCPQCLNKIGYRAKQCKHCSPSKRSQQIRRLKLQTTEALENDAQSKIMTDEQIHVVDINMSGEMTTVSLDTVERREQHETVDISDVLVDNETEISTSYTCNATLEGQQEDTEEIEVVEDSGTQMSVPLEAEPFVPQKDEDIATPQPISTDKLSLQDLICGLLAQNQGATLDSKFPETTVVAEDPNASTETTTIAIQTDPEKQCTTAHTSKDAKSCFKCTKQETSSEQDDKKPELSENSFDANSVALFLGQMAQRNGKKRRIAASTDTGNLGPETRLISFIPAMISPKSLILCSNEIKPAKFRKIQPKNIGDMQAEETVMCEEAKQEIGDWKSEVHCRLMNGNATRRGVMQCVKCQQLIGCRSKVCKHCKNQITEEPLRQNKGKVVRQAVRLNLPKELNFSLYSVRKCKTGPELRCFVRSEGSSSEALSSKTSTVQMFSCDYPLCVTAKELGTKAANFICKHAKACCNLSSTIKARIPRLDNEKLLSFPISDHMKESVRVLHMQCLNKGIPIVQHVSCKTMAVVDKITVEENPFVTDAIGFAHVRFDNIKGQGCFQWQVFCSGRSCMAWNFISTSPEVEGPSSGLTKSCSCVHYAACLWAIASDGSLEKDFGEYLDAFVNQAEISSLAQ